MVLTLVLGLGSAVAEQNRGTEAQRRACTPDVFRLCQSAVPDIPAIIACMKHKRSQLSSECRTALASGTTRSAHRESTHTAHRESTHRAHRESMHTAQRESRHHHATSGHRSKRHQLAQRRELRASR